MAKYWNQKKNNNSLDLYLIGLTEHFVNVSSVDAKKGYLIHSLKYCVCNLSVIVSIILKCQYCEHYNIGEEGHSLRCCETTSLIINVRGQTGEVYTLCRRTSGGDCK